jgi:hypothetical protein
MSAALQTKVSEKPILFSGPMVKAILEGRKTQTRRVIQPQFGMLWGQGVPNEHGFKVMQPAQKKNWRDAYAAHVDLQDETGLWLWIFCPYGKANDRLWVRETAYIAPPNFSDSDHLDAKHRDANGTPRILDYAATMDRDAVRCASDYGVKKTPSIFMPRWASRITLEIKSIRVEKLQEISAEDIDEEGVSESWWPDSNRFAQWQQGWDKINGKRKGCSWADNPWVWVLEFIQLGKVKQ